MNDPSRAGALPPAVFLMGPTASGKTAVAVELVNEFPFEIISVDSALVYRGMDIGTAKPDAEILRAAPHRLIDIRDPSEPYSAAEFRADALDAMAEITARGRVPLLVGGTMLYFRALEKGLSEMPPADPEVRALLEEQAQQLGRAAMHARLQQVDPVSAARIHANDPQRIQRALEVYELSGRPLSSFHAQGRATALPYRLAKLVLAPADRALLQRRIEQRFNAMLAAGFADEVRSLFRRADLGRELPAMRAVGYRQAWVWLEGRVSYEEMVNQAIVATRQYAKRQLTWLRSEEDTWWFDAGAGDVTPEVAHHLQGWLEQYAISM
ncbi:MAG: tRNA (adenosine(37)-N6)-dimethylallyltransferase MiaA [Halobacteria archaeon]|nr:tRNA (adenosine(37)-N6)-dimethylallyltransferase MiaA [Halobacteria archaeon]